MATNQANIKAVITAEDKASKVLSGFGKEVDNTNKSIKSSISASALALTAATAGVVAFGSKSLDAFKSQELATTRLQAGINNVTSATNKNIDSLLEQASALQTTTRFSDEAYVSAQGILSTFQLNQDAIAQLTPRLADMSEGLARVSGGLPDLEGNAILVAKAIGGEDVAGLSGALRRVGVIMTDTQMEMLELGSVEERVRLVTQILDQNFKGLAEAAGTTTAGKIEILKNRFGELQERVGEVLAKALNPVLDALNKHPALLNAVIVGLGGLALAFVAVKTAAAISTVINGAATAMGFLASSSTAATTALQTQVAYLPTASAAFGGFAGALSLHAGTIASAFATMSMVNKETNKITGQAESLIPKLREQGKNAEADKLQGMIDEARKKAKFPGFASGVSNFSGGMAIVGERGRELVNLPGGSDVIPNHETEEILKGSTFNLSVNVGVYAGTEIEKRKLATELLESLKEVAGMRASSLERMLGS